MRCKGESFLASVVHVRHLAWPKGHTSRHRQPAPVPLSDRPLPPSHPTPPHPHHLTLASHLVSASITCHGIPSHPLAGLQYLADVLASNLLQERPLASAPIPLRSDDGVANGGESDCGV